MAVGILEILKLLDKHNFSFIDQEKKEIKPPVFRCRLENTLRAGTASGYKPMHENQGI